MLHSSIAVAVLSGVKIYLAKSLLLSQILGERIRQGIFSYVGVHIAIAVQEMGSAKANASVARICWQSAVVALG
jgi:hypothetical protein